MGIAAAAIGVGAAASIGGALISSHAQKAAANQESQAALAGSQLQVNAAQQAEGTQVQALNEATSALAPYNQIGTGAENQLANLYGIPYYATSNGQGSFSPNGVFTAPNINAAQASYGGQAAQQGAFAAFTNSPNYQFAFNQGLQALQRSAAAGGTLISGGQLKAGEEFGQGLATQQYQNYVANLQSLANTGQSAAAGTAANALSGANSIANTIQGGGQAAASGLVGSANALAGGTTGAANAITSGLGGLSSSVFNSLLLSRLGGTSPSAYAASPATAALSTAAAPGTNFVNTAQVDNGGLLTDFNQ